LLGDDSPCPLDCPLREVIPAFDRNCFGFHELSFRDPSDLSGKVPLRVELCVRAC
jgi:hypothetical protein